MNLLRNRNFMMKYELGTALIIDDNLEEQKLEENKKSKVKLKNQRSKYNIEIKYNGKELSADEIENILENKDEIKSKVSLR